MCHAMSPQPRGGSWHLERPGDYWVSRASFQEPDGGEFFDQLVRAEERSTHWRTQTARMQGTVVQHDQLMGQIDPDRLQPAQLQIWLRFPCDK